MINDLIQKIEESKLRYDLALASSGRSLLRRMANNDIVCKARQQLLGNKESLKAIFERAQGIYVSEIEPGYLNPDDLILATYIFLLGRSADAHVQRFIRMVATQPDSPFQGAIWVAQVFAKGVVENTALSVKPPTIFIGYYMEEQHDVGEMVSLMDIGAERFTLLPKRQFCDLKAA